MKIVVILISVGLILISVFFTTVDKDQRWLIMNGRVAESFAISLLNKDASVETPDRFIDYTVSSTDGYVVFSKYSDHDTVYGYFPNETPSEIGELINYKEWKLLDDNWFVWREGKG